MLTSIILPHTHELVEISYSAGKLASESLQMFWRACCNVSLDGLDAGAVIPLEWNDNPAFILGDKSLGSNIFVRKAYLELGDMLLKGWTPSEHHVVLCGTPGIGKSFFGYFALIVLAKLGKIVVYETFDGQRYLFQEDEESSC